MTHLHLPDGVLPPGLWGAALALAVLLLIASARALRRASPQRIAYQGALGALMLAAMAVQVPLGPLEYHLVLLGPVGVLLGPAAAFQVVFVTGAMLALIGHGGLTVVGLNALVLGAGAAVARGVYAAAPVRSPVAAMGMATAAAQVVSGLLWVAAVGTALRFGAPALDVRRMGWTAAVLIPLGLLAILIETVVAIGIARFLTRVRPDLLPDTGRAATVPAEHAA